MVGFIKSHAPLKIGDPRRSLSIEPIFKAFAAQETVLVKG